MRALYGRIIKKICKIHSVQYCKESETSNPNWQEGFCDICEVTGQPNVPQSVVSPTHFGGLRTELSAELSEPNP